MPRKLLFAVLAATLVLALADVGSALKPQVAGLQVALRAHGVYGGRVDAVRGPRTVRAVKVFQRRSGLFVDGVAGRNTRRALGRLGRPLFGKRVIRPGAVGWDVSVLQFLLARQGFRVGSFDGGFGPRTAEATRAFQGWVGLGRDGVVGPATRRALRSPPNSLENRARVRRTLVRAARRYHVRPELVRALAWVESGFQPSVVSPVGAWGVMQVMPQTWVFVESMTGPVPKTPAGNIRVGVRYLRYLLREFRGSERKALAAYNQGPASVRERGIYRETRAFVAAVRALAARL
jgi:peptidoglycan hydrolase-like protein with peptidoglycan-binding domain